MKVTQEKLPASQIGLSIEIPPEKSKQAYEQVIQNFARAANIPGFRKGKVPRQILLQRLGIGRLKAQAVEEVIQDGIQQALKQETIAAIGTPQLTSSFEDLVNQYDPGKPLTFSAAVDVQPEVNLAEYSGMIVQAEEVKYNPSQVEAVLEENRTERATLIPIEGRSAELGDVAVVDFKGHLMTEGSESVEPEEIPGATATDFQVELQAGRFIEGFVAGIVGMNPGETKEVPVKFPEEYSQKDVAGSSALFTITLKELKEKELPELNDDFAQEISEFETLEELRSSLESRFKSEAEQKTKANVRQVLSDELLKHLEIDLPETLISQEVDALLTQTAVTLTRQGVDVKKLFTPENIPQFRERSRPEAIENLKRTLALLEVAKRESLQVEAVELEARVKEVRAQYEGKEIDLERLQQVVEEELLTEKIMNWLEEHATVELVPFGSLNATEPQTQQEEATDVAQASEVTLETNYEVVPDEAALNPPEPDTQEETTTVTPSDLAQTSTSQPDSEPAHGGE